MRRSFEGANARESVRCLVLLLIVGCVHAPAGQGPSVREVMYQHVRPDGPNARHMERLAHLVPRFAGPEGASIEVVEAAALLHDATKEDGAGTGFERFCTHHQQAAALARNALKYTFSPGVVDRIAQAIEQHMGPLGDNPDFSAPRFMTGFCKREFPTPTSIEAKVLFDLDMLDLMTVDGVVKVVTLRQRNAEFARESVRASATTGTDSAWKSVVDARQVLLTTTGRACGNAVKEHTRAFLDSVDFDTVTTVEAFDATAARWLGRNPLPPCVRP